MGLGSPKLPLAWPRFEPVEHSHALKLDCCAVAETSDQKIGRKSLGVKVPTRNLTLAREEFGK